MELGDIGAKGCFKYLNAAECEAYASRESSMTWNRVDSWYNYPKGCFWQTENNNVYYNTHTRGAGISRPATRPVCKASGKQILMVHKSVRQKGKQASEQVFVATLPRSFTPIHVFILHCWL